MKQLVALLLAVFSLSGVVLFFYGAWIRDAWLFAVGGSFLVIFLLLGILTNLSKLYDLLLSAAEHALTEIENGEEEETRAHSNGHFRR